MTKIAVEDSSETFAESPHDNNLVGLEITCSEGLHQQRNNVATLELLIAICLDTSRPTDAEQIAGRRLALILKLMVESHSESSADFYEKTNGIKAVEQLPWSKPRQRLQYVDDSFKNVRKSFCNFVELLEKDDPVSDEASCVPP